MNDFRSRFLPYCIEKQEDGGYVVLNRRYKPLGFSSEESYDYSDFPVLAKIKITKSMARALSCCAAENVNKIYLYNDSCVPTKSAANMALYLEKIDRLAKWKVEQK